MKRYLWISIACFLIAAYGISLMGCATTQDRAQFYQAQQEFVKMQMSQEQKPMIDLKAVEGKSIENLERLTIYMPTAGQIRDFKQFSEAHPGWEVAKDGIRMVTTLGGIGLVVNGVTGLAESVGKYSGGNTTYNQSVSGGSTAQIRTMGDMRTGNIGSGNTVGGLIDQTSTPTVVYQPPPVVIEPSYPPTP